MSWKGGPCWHCWADLDGLVDYRRRGLDLNEIQMETIEREFMRHMNAECLSAPLHDREWARVYQLESWAEEDGRIREAQQ